MARQRKNKGTNQTAQGGLFGGSVPIQTQVISRKRDFTGLFEGFSRMRAVSYVLSPELLLEFFDSFGYAQLEVVVGENLAEPYKRSLEQKGATVVGKLAGAPVLEGMRPSDD